MRYSVTLAKIRIMEGYYNGQLALDSIKLSENIRSMDRFSARHSLWRGSGLSDRASRKFDNRAVLFFMQTTTTRQTRLNANRDYLNPKFNGYKLEPFPDKECIVRADLPGNGIASFGDAQPGRIGFRELQARVRFNHLSLGFPTEHGLIGSAYYINQANQVVQVTFNKDSRAIGFTPLVRLAERIETIPSYVEPDPKVPVDAQVPSVLALSEKLLLACNGDGVIELIELKDGKGTVVATADYEGAQDEGISPVPCVLLSARLVGNSITFVVYSRAAATKTKFNVAILEWQVGSDIKILHVQQGSEVPVYCDLTPDARFCVLGSEASYERLAEGDVTMEDADVQQRDALQQATAAAAANVPPPPAPYQWTQDKADITIQMVLPAGTPRSAITCHFAPTHLTLMVRAQDFEVSYAYRKLWTTVRPDECTWTLEKDGLLSLFLTKHDENTRWPHVFDADDGVLETMDQAKLAEITQRLEKFTQQTEDKGGPFVQAAQHPVATDMDEDIDQEGQPLRLSVYDRDGQRIQDISSGGHEWMCNAFEAPNQLSKVAIKSDVDTLSFHLLETPKGLEPEHSATFDALAFVQASKRDSRFVRYDPDHRFAVIVESNRNVYIYYRHGDKRATEKQTLVDVTLGHDVNILGVQLILDRVLLILTETQIVGLVI
ncbi:hypothetical protein BCR43DRAFT_567128 [Syncephalastrum racemosum]|uniref:NudC domain-containing protein 1 n=1 Tax=Syncephalastrum racemosum TaxID=13706 RepID=A0A1X2GZD4_SYNRA|nr:hypothetical protein BCR43DRAFT_567128 [Syncephalastrum racemosum]